MKEPESLDEYLKLTDEQKMELMLQERERREQAEKEASPSVPE
jgi:hypothetical protein